MSEEEREQLISLLQWMIAETKDICFVIDNEIHETDGHRLLMSPEKRVLH